MPRPTVRNPLLLGTMAFVVCALLACTIRAAGAEAATKRLTGKQGDPNFALVEGSDGRLAVNRFEVKQLPVTCVVDGGKPIATEMRIVVWRLLPVNRRTGQFAGTQKTSTNELEEFPEAASTVTTRLKGRLGSDGRSGEGMITLRSHALQLVPGGRVVSECTTSGWVHWKAFG